jgi:preprotein translocase SecE subunit
VELAGERWRQLTTDQERFNVANKMADKKKTTSRSQMAEPKPRTTSEKAPIVKAAPREERKEQPKQVKRSSKGSIGTIQRLRNGRVGRFITEAYYELRHKVTWPSFEEARNMTIVVIIISVVIGGILGLVDYGLYNLFLYISGR